MTTTFYRRATRGKRVESGLNVSIPENCMSDNTYRYALTRVENRYFPGRNPKSAREGERLGHIRQAVPLHSGVLRDVQAP